MAKRSDETMYDDKLLNRTLIRAIDLFCGAGGSSWGAQTAGIHLVAAFDRWSLAGSAHSLNFPSTDFIEGCLEAHDVNNLAEKYKNVDLILASPECTNHSPAKGNKPRSEQSKNTAFQVVRYAAAFNPRWIIIENVVNMRKWSRYSEFKSELSQLGYHLSEQILNAAAFGVPQARNRLFILADKDEPPDPVRAKNTKLRTAAEIIDLNGHYAWKPLHQEGRAAATIQRAERAISELGKNEPFLIVYYGSDGGGGWQRLTRPLRTITTVDRFAVVKPDAMNGHVMRMLQVPELLEAMGMPKKMQLVDGTRRDKIKMIGNAVCPPVMTAVIKSLTKGVR
ncbi:MAG: putative BsuMI modification methylase subunit YdiO [Syntrophorhabdus sp. PtaU1.Bin153]|nr:MAG: putative BsuMI modification methylase subunit YdiO [Syntrophorhabdus sp. PtaU1.Bin153]